MINYIIQVILFQVLFVAVYDFFLSKETFFNKNRWYLLSTALLSFMLPLFKIPTVQKAVPQEYYTLLPEVVLSPQKVIEKAAWYQSVNYLDLLFWIGCLLFFVVFLIKLERIVRLVLQYGVARKENYKLVLLPKETKAFSFFNYIFLGNEIPSSKREKIIQHELVHSKQKHTLDLLFFEFLKIVMWFNPMVYVYQNRISLVHEYISDAIASKSDKKENYINHLLADIFQVEHISFINQFYKHSLIKKRIIMMTKTQSKKVKQLKYLLLIPLLGIMLLYTSCSQDNSGLEQKKENTVMYSEVEGMKRRVSDSKQSYMDMYMGFETPKSKELKLSDLTSLELSEYNEKVDGFKKNGHDVELRVFEGIENKERKVLFLDMQASLKKFKSQQKNKSIDLNNIPFSLLDKVPTFPGCVEGDKVCFNRSLQKFVKENFDTSIANELGLDSGKKRLYIKFKIDKKGNVTDIMARAPHPTLKQHAEELAHKLPQMQPGEKDGKIVATGFVLPITFNVE
ncbi:BlaR1 peptidase M56 [Tenacibaculum discolor]|uniref:BlaR1 peptidase M56 n=1 Tax=Tenacibaculum discolor TaxID=361581 RepID=A0A2G1BTA1_9FLAO|nr:M56 family metallopeptidase [Tenacibaculum discolor]MDP2542629.1 M56 family metallopeptidase [Tenacibaculum discolor]PHN97238.1 BlaR1 peptidase M56 [Tenacibaculum discolor]